MSDVSSNEGINQLNLFAEVTAPGPQEDTWASLVLVVLICAALAAILIGALIAVAVLLRNRKRKRYLGINYKNRNSDSFKDSLKTSKFRKVDNDLCGGHADNTTAQLLRNPRRRDTAAEKGGNSWMFDDTKNQNHALQNICEILKKNIKESDDQYAKKTIQSGVDWDKNDAVHQPNGTHILKNNATDASYNRPALTRDDNFLSDYSGDLASLNEFLQQDNPKPLRHQDSRSMPALNAHLEALNFILESPQLQERSNLAQNIRPRSFTDKLNHIIVGSSKNSSHTRSPYPTRPRSFNDKLHLLVNQKHDASAVRPHSLYNKAAAASSNFVRNSGRRSSVGAARLCQVMHASPPTHDKGEASERASNRGSSLSGLKAALSKKLDSMKAKFRSSDQNTNYSIPVNNTVSASTDKSITDKTNTNVSCTENVEVINENTDRHQVIVGTSCDSEYVRTLSEFEMPKDISVFSSINFEGVFIPSGQNVSAGESLIFTVGDTSQDTTNGLIKLSMPETLNTSSLAGKPLARQFQTEQYLSGRGDDFDDLKRFGGSEGQKHQTSWRSCSAIDTIASHAITETMLV